MRDIFADLYNKVMSFFSQPAEKPDPTKGVAMNRLKTVLMQDRVGFSERAIQMLREELVTCVSKYMEIDDELFDLHLDAQDEKTLFLLSIPVVRPKTDEEIDKAIKEQALKNQEKAQEIVQELEELIKERAQALAENIKEETDDTKETSLQDEDFETTALQTEETTQQTTEIEEPEQEKFQEEEQKKTKKAKH